MLEQFIKNKKKSMILTSIVLTVLIGMQGMVNANVNIDKVHSIDVWYNKGVNGTSEASSQKQLNEKEYGYFSDNEIVNQYLLHYINSFRLIDDGKNVYGGDVPRGRIKIKYYDGHIENIRFFAWRYINQQGRQYGMDYNEYFRFWDFIYALKSGAIILNDNISYEPSKWADGDVLNAIDDGLVSKWHQIDYKKSITRLEFCQLIDDFLSANKITVEEDIKNPFIDTTDVAVLKLYTFGIIKGKSETEFFPYDFITREEAAKILSCTYRLVNDSITIKEKESFYKDEETISDWAAVYVEDMTWLGFLRGNDDGEFAPKKNITKEEVIVVLGRMHDSIRII